MDTQRNGYSTIERPSDNGIWRTHAIALTLLTRLSFMNGNDCTFFHVRSTMSGFSLSQGAACVSVLQEQQYALLLFIYFFSNKELLIDFIVVAFQFGF